MSKAPPPPPEHNAKILARVLRVAELEGKSVVVIAAISAVMSVLGHPDWFGVLVSLLAVGCGVTELHGARLLRGSKGRGVDWLVRAELLLLGVIIFYAVTKFFLYSQGNVTAELAKLSPDERAGAEQFFSMFTSIRFAELPAWISKFVRLVCVVTMAVSVLFQGSLALYYHRRRAAVAAALAQLPANNPLLTACPVCKKTVSRTAPMCPHCGHPLAPTAAA